jgi:hypothetical protein
VTKFPDRCENIERCVKHLYPLDTTTYTHAHHLADNEMSITPHLFRVF